LKHALVVGGSGMLLDVSRWLMNNGYHVSVIGRSQEKMNRLIDTNTEHLITPILVDYNNDHELNEKMKNLINQNGKIDLIISWIHSYAEGALKTIVKHNSVNNDNWTLLQVLGSKANLFEEEKKVNLPAKCTYRTVQLGFIIENNNARWLTHDEISDGVIKAINSVNPRTTIGVTEPMEERPN